MMLFQQSTFDPVTVRLRLK